MITAPTLSNDSLRVRFTNGAMSVSEFERQGGTVRVNPTGPFLVMVGMATDLAMDASCAGTGTITLFEDWLRPYLDDGALESLLEPW